MFGYTGRAKDNVTGLQNNLNRWYDSKTGGWISKDPTGFDAGDTNLYRYVRNSPTNATDPSGLWLGMGLPSWTDYKSYLWHPSRMDMDLRVGQGVAAGVAATAGATAAAIAAAGAAAGAAAAGAASAGEAAALGIGTQAVVAPGLGAGVWPALMVNGTVYVARFHVVAWEMAQHAQETKYGMVIIDAAGKVIGWK